MRWNRKTFEEKNMNSKTCTRIITLTLFAVLALPLQLAAQGTAKQHQTRQYHHYQINDVGTFGGPSNGLQAPFYPRFGVLDNHGTLVGYANTPASDAPFCGFGNCYAGDAFQFHDGVLTDLGRVPGGYDSQANWISGNGLIAGLGDNGVLDPLAGFPIPYLHGLLWDHGTMTDLGTLPEGGNFIFPIGVNNRGEVVGQAQNTVPDPNSMVSGYGTQTRAFYWKDGRMQDLGTLGTGTDATAAVINNQGQVIGWSYVNSDPSPLCASLWNFGFVLHTGSFIWDKKHGMRDIGSLGGTCTIATDINDRGQVVGISAVTGDLLMHPFVWDAATGMTDLGAADGNSSIFALIINEHGVVAGSACGPNLPGDCHSLVWHKAGGTWKKTDLGVAGTVTTSINASGQVIGYGYTEYLWQDDGPTVDLNALLPPNSNLQIYEADQINDRGEIAVQASDVNNNNHALLLIPCDEDHPSVEGCDYDTIDAETAAAQSATHPKGPSPTKLPLQPRWSNRYHVTGRQSPGK
jgi:probable HAF family extracellular repeat protein